MADNTNDARRGLGNRPADNARHATPSSLAGQQNWQGGAEASDFLGLNEAPPAPEPAPVNSARPATSGAMPARAANDESWLMDDAEPAPEPAAQEPDPIVLDESEDDEPVEAGSMRAPSVLDASWTEPGARRASRKRPMLIAAGAVAILALAGVQMLPAHKPDSREPDAATEVAQVDAAVDNAAMPTPPTAPTELEMPKPPRSSASSAPAGNSGRESGAGRMAVDRTGRAVPNANPVLAANNDVAVSRVAERAKTPAARPKSVPAASAATPAPGSPGTTARIVPVRSAPVEHDSAPPAPPEIALAAVESPAQKPAEIRPKFLAQSPAAEAAGATTAPGGVVAPAQISEGPTLAAISPANASPTRDTSSPAAVASGVAALKATPPAPEEGGIQLAGVRVLATHTQPLVDSVNQRPDQDRHPSAVPTEASKIEPTDATPEVAPAPELPAHPAAVASREGSIGASDVLLSPAPIHGVRAAQEQDLQSIWNGESVPMDRVGAATKVLTPNVGNVRVTLKSSDTFEGRLYAVGENSVWLEGPFGRMGLSNDRVVSVDRLASATPAAAAGAKVGAAPKSDRVRVRTPQGLVLGRVQSIEGLKAKVVTDSGLKLTVDTIALEYLEQTPKIVIKQNAPKG